MRNIDVQSITQYLSIVFKIQHITYVFKQNLPWIDESAIEQTLIPVVFPSIQIIWFNY